VTGAWGAFVCRAVPGHSASHVPPPYRAARVSPRHASVGPERTTLNLVHNEGRATEPHRISIRVRDPRSRVKRYQLVEVVVRPYREPTKGGAER
jgi:hypothetical protein